MSDCFPIAARSPSSTQPINAQSSSRERFSCSTYFPAPATQTVIFQFPSPFYLQCTDQSGLRFWFFKTAIGHLTWDFPSATKGSKPDIAITKIEIMKKIAGSPVSTIVNFQYRFISLLQDFPFSLKERKGQPFFKLMQSGEFTSV